MGTSWMAVLVDQRHEFRKTLQPFGSFFSDWRQSVVPIQDAISVFDM
jgi:hypothetical protein